MAEVTSDTVRAMEAHTIAIAALQAAYDLGRDAEREKWGAVIGDIKGIFAEAKKRPADPGYVNRTMGERLRALRTEAKDNPGEVE